MTETWAVFMLEHTPERKDSYISTLNPNLKVLKARWRQQVQVCLQNPGSRQGMANEHEAASLQLFSELYQQIFRKVLQRIFVIPFTLTLKE